MARMPAEDALARALAERTGTQAEDWFCVFKARYGMQAALAALRRATGEGSAVTQLFTCLTAVVPIVAAGLAPAYCDVSARTASLDPERLRLPADARAVMLQHTYGIIDDAESAELARRAHAAGALVVEDSAHCVCRMARDAAGEPVADVSVHSFGVEKILPTHFGGAVWVNPRSPLAALASAVRAALAALPDPPARLDALARRYRTENRVLAHLPAGVSARLRRSLVSSGAMEPAVSEAERRGLAAREPVRASAWVCERALAALAGLDEAEALRRETVAAYRAELAGASTLPAALEGPTQPLLRYPVLAPDTAAADRVVAGVCAAGLFAEAWYRPELGPGVLDAAAFGVPAERSGLPVHERLVATCAALPADVGAAGARRAAGAVRAAIGGPAD
ncbi:DegT/DnrJ/EryC1/StrS aminotransferase family protein [Olsenella uli]|uniref:DegT/DnrJ/EryC1/StrS family aminotransferase n=1 Tax=Olsenella uli TaxID=133926 RepID=UPI00195A63DA|nr:DegT/DnrJ/EryC1/StrS family aminotransferase [Olsenella uli]MBM6817674.1 DegT/DnrJ/EryC1/StrS aminotransferase family protein [Olsenella uli]